VSRQAPLRTLLLIRSRPLATVGRRTDLDIATADGPLRAYELMYDARPVLFNFDQPRVLDITPWTDRVQLIDAECGGGWELPVLGSVSAPVAVVIRPDGYGAWVGDDTDTGLRDALTTWCSEVETDGCRVRRPPGAIHLRGPPRHTRAANSRVDQPASHGGGQHSVIPMRGVLLGLIGAAGPR
jgi:hypothetical protein